MPSSTRACPSLKVSSTSASSSLLMSDEESRAESAVPSTLTAESSLRLKLAAATSCSEAPRSCWNSAACSCMIIVSPDWGKGKGWG